MLEYAWGAVACNLLAVGHHWDSMDTTGLERLELVFHLLQGL